MTSRLTSVTFKMASKVFIEETDKKFDFITDILFRFLGFGDFKVSYCHRNEMSSEIMNVYGQSYRPVTL